MNRLKNLFRWFVDSRLKRWTFLYVPVLLFSLILLSNHLVEKAGHGKIYSRIEDVPARKTALVFGTSPRTKRGKNLFYSYRMQAAADLWKSGKVSHIIVSGDNHTLSYDEATYMKISLNEFGVPDSVITLDYAGFRTLDSVVRCKWVFGQDDVIVVSQQFQNERALFIAEHFGINAIAFNAQDVPNRYGTVTSVREYLARVKAVLDIYVLKTQPKFPGPPEPIR